MLRTVCWVFGLKQSINCQHYNGLKAAIDYSFKNGLKVMNIIRFISISLAVVLSFSCLQCPPSVGPVPSGAQLEWQQGR